MEQYSTPLTPPETTDLERRVLAHERILKSLIAYISATEPRFLDHMSKTFVEPLAMVRREHDYTGSDDYAEEFIRAVVAQGDTEPGRNRAGLGPLSPKINASNDATLVPSPAGSAERVQTRRRNGIWTVTVDGVFRGDYQEREHAEAAAAVVRLSIC
ncbi:MAG: hypothetical protein HLUCCA12_14600 [Rhodobacteraceae bacterium HLUCCA12]|nr:MAG: hypothetical protein HLUCCA12_14600 [Rhodobacteraceae bacterium HLUCCA12]